MCPEIKSLEVDAGNSEFYSKGNCIIRKNTQELILGCQNSIIPNGVKKIGSDSDFCGSSKIKSLKIPASVMSISAAAFKGCSSLTSLSVDSGNSVYYSEGNCIIRKEIKELVRGCSSSVIPEEVTSIGLYAFCGTNFGLRSISIPIGVKTIRNYAFGSCSFLRSFNIYYEGSKALWDSISILDSDVKSAYISCTDECCFNAYGSWMPHQIRDWSCWMCGRSDKECL